MTTTYVSEGDSATPSNMNTWLNAVGGEVFNVKASAYGATGDGSTDDTTAIQAALDAADSAGGGVVFFPQGVYILSSALTVGSYTTLMGVNGNDNIYGGISSSFTATSASILRQAASATSLARLVYISSKAGVKLQGLSLEGGEGSSAQIGSTIGLDIDDSDSVHLYDVKVWGFGGVGITVDDSQDLVESSVWCNFNKGGGQVWTNVDDSFVFMSSCLNNREGFTPGTDGAGASHGFVMNGCAGNQFVSLRVEWSDGYGLYIHTSSNENIFNNLFLDRNGFAGLYALNNSNNQFGTVNIRRNGARGDTSTSYQNSANAFIDTETGSIFSNLLVQKGDIADGGGGDITPEYGLVLDSTSRCQILGRLRDGSTDGGTKDVVYVGTNAYLRLISVGNNNNYQIRTTTTTGADSFSVSESANGSNTFVDDLQVAGRLRISGVTALEDDATPTVQGLSAFTTGGTTTITDFDDGVVGQLITILAKHSVTITHGASTIVLNGGANFAMASGDTLTLFMFESGIWYEIGRSDNTP